MIKNDLKSPFSTPSQAQDTTYEHLCRPGGGKGAHTRRQHMWCSLQSPYLLLPLWRAAAYPGTASMCLSHPSRPWARDPLKQPRPVEGPCALWVATDLTESTATVPGRYRRGPFLRPPLAGAAWRAAFVASCLRGALPHDERRLRVSLIESSGRAGFLGGSRQKRKRAGVAREPS